MIHKTWQGTWLEVMALVGLVAGLAFTLNPPPSDPLIDVPETLRSLHYMDLKRVLFGVGVTGWAALTFFSSHRGRVWPAISACSAIGLGISAVKLAGPLWFELSSFVAAGCVAAILIPSVALLASRTEAQ